MLVDQLSGPFSCTVVPGGKPRQRGGLGLLGGEGDDGDVEFFASSAVILASRNRFLGTVRPDTAPQVIPAGLACLLKRHSLALCHVELASRRAGRD